MVSPIPPNFSHFRNRRGSFGFDKSDAAFGSEPDDGKSVATHVATAWAAHGHQRFARETVTRALASCVSRLTTAHTLLFDKVCERMSV